MVKPTTYVLLLTALLSACAPVPISPPTAAPTSATYTPATTPTPVKTPAPTPTPLFTESFVSSEEEAIDEFLKGKIPTSDEELFRLKIDSQHPEKIGYFYIDEAKNDYPAMGRIQLIILGGRKESNKVIMTVGTLDPKTEERVVVEVCIGILDTQYLNQTYIINTRTGYPYILDYGTIVAELLPAESIIQILKDNIGKPVVVTFFLAPPLDSSSLERIFDEPYKEEYTNHILPSFEANRMLFKNPRQLSALQKENQNFLPYTYGPIKFWFMRRNPND